MATETSFETMLDEDVAIRVRFVWDAGEISEFVVQLEYFVKGQWQPVVRYDTAHGFAHRDILRPDRTQEKHMLDMSSFREAMAYADTDIRSNYAMYCERFVRWIDERPNR